jgi:hypothetical protein
MNVNDLIEVELSNGVHLWWRVSAVYLGAENQESVVHLVPADQKPNTQGTPTLVPAQMLDASMTPGCFVRRHSAAERTPRESELLDLLMRSNEVLRSCFSIIERRGENTNWDGLKNCVDCELKNQHSVLAPLRFERLHQAHEAMEPTHGECPMPRVASTDGIPRRYPAMEMRRGGREVEPDKR